MLFPLHGTGVHTGATGAASKIPQIIGIQVNDHPKTDWIYQ
jgi:hypothetical protein